MYSFVKKEQVSKVWGSCPRMLIILVGVLLMVTSCSIDKDGDDIVPKAKPGDGAAAVADKISDYLLLDGGTKVDGKVPASLDEGLKINFKDTVYLMNDNPYKARLSVFSADASQITGFNVSVKGLSNPHYYNVPVVEQESTDSTRTIYLGFDPADDELELPFTFEIVIQPHGSDGTPLDETSTPVTIEESSGCPISTENTYYWQWMYTMYSYPGDNLKKLTAPWFSATYSEDAKGGYYYGKCCMLQNGIYGEIYLGDRGCTQQSPNYKEMFITTPYSLIPYEYLLLGDKTFIFYNAAFNVNFSPQKSSICYLRAYYNKTSTAYTKTGSYTLDADNYFLPKVETSNPAFGPGGPFGTVEYSCHLLIFSYLIEGVQKYKRAYQRSPDIHSGGYDIPPDPEDYLHQWFDF